MNCNLNLSVLTDSNCDIHRAKGLNHAPNLTVVCMYVQSGLQNFESSPRVLESMVFRKLNGYKNVKFYLSSP